MKINKLLEKYIKLNFSLSIEEEKELDFLEDLQVTPMTLKKKSLEIFIKMKA